jgi:hypothetical protein
MIVGENFQREGRYIVVKRSRVTAEDEQVILNSVPPKALVDCVVIESDWPEYEPVWTMLETRCAAPPEHHLRRAATVDSSPVPDPRYCGCEHVPCEHRPACSTPRCHNPAYCGGLCNECFHEWLHNGGTACMGDERDPASNERIFGSEPNEYPNAKPCTCHPDDRTAECQHRYAATECNAAFNAKDDAVEAVTPAMIESGCAAYRNSHWGEPTPADIVAIFKAMRAAQAIDAGTVKTASGLDGEATKARSRKGCAPKEVS